MLDERREQEVEEFRQKLTAFFESYPQATEVQQKTYIETAMNWQRIGFLKKLDDPYIQAHMAIILENQRLWNGMSIDRKSAVDALTFARLSMPTVRRAYDPDSFWGWNLVSVQSHLGQTGMFQSSSKEGTKQIEMTAKTKKMRFYPPVYETKTTGRSGPTDNKSFEEVISYEIDYVKEMSKEISQEINREIVTDLRNNAGTICKGSNALEACVKMSSAIEEKVGFRANWLVTSSEMIQSFGEHFTDSGKEVVLNQRKAGVLKHQDDEWTVFEDQLFPSKQILLGYKGEDPYFSGYFYNIYVPLEQTPVVFEPDFCPRSGVLTRYSKKLLPGGAGFYGRIVIE